LQPGALQFDEIPFSGRCEQRSTFIGYASQDGAEHAQRLDRELRLHGVSTWLNLHDLNPAVDFTYQLESAIEAADNVIACITAATKKRSSYLRREIAYAQEYGKPIAVARFEPIPPPISVATNTFFEFYSDWGLAFSRLLGFCRTVTA
jgi:hypothetical protein